MGDQMTGHGLQRNVEDAYRRLMRCHESGDRVYLFGFSRGAFTVRSLAGMLHKCGLLDAGHENLVEYASKVYNTAGNDDVAAGFRSTFGRDCPVEFIGVWDTVDSLVMNAGKRWHDHALSPEVRFGIPRARHRRAAPGLRAVLVGRSGRDRGPGHRAGVVRGRPLRRGGLVRRARAFERRAPLDAGEGVGPAACALTGQGSHRAAPTRTARCTSPGPGSGKARPRRTRKVPEGARIHRSVVERRDGGRVRYAPKNLPANLTVVD